MIATEAGDTRRRECLRCGHVLSKAPSNSPLVMQIKQVLRRARKLPVGPARNDLRQLARGLLRLHRAGVNANVHIIEKPDRLH